MKKIFTLLFLSPGLLVSAQDMKAYDQAIPGSTVKFRMIPIQAATFMMGSEAAEKDRDDDEAPVKVQVSAYWIAEHEVTFEAWDEFFKNMEVPQTKNISIDAVSRPTAQYIDLTWGMGRDPKHPTNSMSQQAALMYCKWLYEKTGVFYRLPTEAEWEYACRGGAKPVANAGDLASHGFFRENSEGKFQKVKSLRPNGFGLYDMLGNLSEWTLDQYEADRVARFGSNAKDPGVAPATRYSKVVKGGSYLDEARMLRCADRQVSQPAWNKRDPQVPKSKWWLTDGMFVGFRVVRPYIQPSADDIKTFFELHLKQ